MLHWLLTLDIAEGVVPWTVWGIATAAVLVLIARRPTARWVRRALIAVLAGGVLGFLTAVLGEAWNLFGGALPGSARWWAAGAFAAVALGIVSLWDSRWWHKVTAIILVIAALLSGTIGINAAFGLDRTPGELLGISTHAQAGVFPAPDPHATSTVPLAASWKPPADMPKKSAVFSLSGDKAIPSTAGFVPRDGTIILPPAARVANPPALPVVVQMMGLPGNPDSSAVKDVLDKFAAEHDGLGPIVIIADQLGEQSQNPGCADTKTYGGVSTYFNTDIPQYIRTHLRVLQDPQYWTISGYSNGGACSFLYGAEHPEIWGNIIDVSGERWPGYGDEKSVLDEALKGDKAAFEANKPESVLLRHPGAYTDRRAVFTAGSEDKKYGPPAKAAADSASAAGFDATFYLVQGASHTGKALDDGLAEAFRQLAPRWGLVTQ
ncbi:hypothetical protein J2Y69_001825 [Microbacterium resistens]|uniref:Esterase n=1 Tax=Microbacterium resistens TaxID=156977 RepID=A0ABU1SC85_9MICO|nr:alpha/beta hydrolase-fold protein [Microbacterium resistens]MDR6867224.1 hypothetical protein [Microbacterium resistens]